VALAAFDSDHKEPYLIDRIPYDKLYELLADMAPTLVAMEPCSGAHQIAEQIQELGHEVMMISGRHVQAWVKDHCNGQKTDFNDAFAILNLAYDRWLTPRRVRNAVCLLCRPPIAN
jgi:transposase